MAMSPYPNPFPEGEGTVRRRSVISHAIAIPLSLQDEGFPATASTTRTVPLFSLSLQGEGRGEGISPHISPIKHDKTAYPPESLPGA